MVRAFLGLGLCGLFAAGCGSSSDDPPTIEGAPLDCAWLASDNCWKQLVAVAASCAPPMAEHGMFSADGGSCTYTSGTTVTFDPKVPLPIPEEGVETWGFSQGQGGNECVQFHKDVNDSQTLTVQGMTYSDRVIGIGEQVTCPDGSKFAAQSAFDLLKCSNLFTDAPSYSASFVAPAMNFSLNAGSQNVLVWDCWQ